MVAKKKAHKRPAKRRATKTKKSASGAIRIAVTPPGLAGDSTAFQSSKLFRRKSTRPAPEELAVYPWFRQDEPYQIGYHLLTYGLREQAGHPEIELCNVPGVFINAAADLLNQIADCVLEGERFAGGETMGFDDDRGYFKVVVFREIVAGRLLRVVFLY